MASDRSLITLVGLAFVLVLCLQSALGRDVTCDRLNISTCSFAVSSTGMRCVLDKQVTRGGKEKYTCRASDIKVEKLRNWIESDECVEACGVDRNSLGISSDCLMDPPFTRKLCSSQCYRRCPNIIDLYFKIAISEGVSPTKLCKANGSKADQGKAEI